jgi:hypothetical protein
VSADEPGLHGDAHGPRDEHDEATHGAQPLTDVDPADLLRAVDDLAATLREYVGTAVGVRAEFGAHEADEDPRVLALETRVATLNAALYDLVHERLGLHSDLTGLTWDGHADDDERGATAPGEVEAFHLGFAVGPVTGTSDLSMDSVLGILDEGGTEIARRLIDNGFDVPEWGAARGAPVLFEDDEDDS